MLVAYGLAHVSVARGQEGGDSVVEIRQEPLIGKWMDTSESYVEKDAAFVSAGCTWVSEMRDQLTVGCPKRAEPWAPFGFWQ